MINEKIRMYTISLRYKLLSLIGVVFIGGSCLCTILFHDYDYWFKSWFIFPVAFELFIITVVIYYFTYRIIITDDCIGKYQIFLHKEICFKDIKTIVFCGHNTHVKIIASDKRLIRVPLTDIISNRLNLFIQIHEIKKRLFSDNNEKIKEENIIDNTQMKLTAINKRLQKEFIKISCIVFLKLIITLCGSFLGTLFLGKILGKILFKINIRLLAIGIFCILFFIIWKILGKIDSIFQSHKSNKVKKK